MANKKITELPTIASVALADLVPIVDDALGTPVTKYATIEQIQTAIGGGGSALAMGFELGTEPLKHYRSVLHFTTDSSEVGTLKITLPKAKLSTAFLKIVISGFQYTSDESNWDLSVTGYDSSGAGWVYPDAIIRGNAPFSTVRFGNDGTDGVLLLGGLTTDWKYAQIAISDVYVGLSEPINSDWGTGWAAAVIASEAGLANLVSAAIKTNKKIVCAVLPTSVPLSDTTLDNHWRTTIGPNALMLGAVNLSGGGGGYPAYIQSAHDTLTFLQYNLLVQPLGGNTGIGCTDPQVKLDIADDSIRVRTSKTPASASATGFAGQIAWDASYLYVCTATDTWKRVAIATWP